MAKAEGLTATTIDHGRRGLLLFHRFLKERYRKDLPNAEWQDFAAYRKHLLSSGLANASIKNYLGSVTSYYLLVARQAGNTRALELYTRMKLIKGNIERGMRSQPYEPFSRESLQRIIKAARASRYLRRSNRWVDSEDYAVTMLLLYSGGRSQFYGLRVDEVDFEREEIHTRTKGGLPLVIPLHPKLAEVLKAHLASRKYDSSYLFRNGKSPTTLRGRDANHANALMVCRRIQYATGLGESVHPHRFRKTLATMGRNLGMDLQHVQAILGHRSVLQTMNLYARPDLDSIKRDFAGVDLVGGHPKPQTPSYEVIAALKRIAPRGKERAWATLVDGFVELLLGKGSREVEFIWQSHHEVKFSARGAGVRTHVLR